MLPATDAVGLACGAFLAADAEGPYAGYETLRLAQSHRAQGHAAAAVAAYEEILEQDPRQPEALLGLAAILLSSERQLPRAQMLLLRCCGIVPERPEAWDALGVSLLLTDDPRAAESAFAEAQRLAPWMLDYALHRAEASLSAGTAEIELARLAAAIQSNPLDVPSLTARALLLDKLGHLAEAVDLLETAQALCPDVFAITVLLGRLLSRLNRPAQAEALLARAVELNGSDPQPRNDRAVMLLRLRRAVEAKSMLLDLVREHPTQPTILCNLANALTALGEQEEAVRTAQAAIALAPHACLPRRTLCNALPYRAGVTALELLRASQECADRLPRAAVPAWRNSPDKGRRLRIGLLSGSLKMHPVGWFTIAGFEALDPSRFALVCLAQDDASDSVARRFRSIAAEWHTVGGLTDTALAETVRELGIDILLELGGYGEGGRMPVCAFRPAPVQIKWVGMQNHSSGLPEMDWFITDRWETPPGFEAFYAERLLRLQDGYVCYSPPTDAPDVVRLPMLDNGFVTFGCFNNLAKITPLVISTWAEVLRAIPAARLILRSHPFDDAQVRGGLHEAFLEQGIASGRVELLGALPHRRLLAEYGRLDIVLDPFPYSGGLTTCESLWMGVPVVTLPGETFSSRHSMSHLHNLGLQDWVAEDRTQYVALALQKAADPFSLARLRADLRARMLASPLCDGARFGRGLDEALRMAWTDWCERAA